ncbi:hypothetical protein BVY03_04035 [bacterium K02(2017)]|nr:hypothetical protein BVY03_04035 [bacterium K02(2017)]
MVSTLNKRPDFKEYKPTYIADIQDKIISENQIKNYMLSNPILDEGGNVIDYVNGSDNGGWGVNGHGLSEDARGEILKSMNTANGTIKSSIIEANAMLISSANEAEAAVTVAVVDAESRVQESENALKGIQVQAETDLEIAKMERDVEMEKLEVEREKLDVERYRIDNVDSVNASANVRAADAEHVEAEGEKARDEGRAARYKYNSGSDNYWQGYTNIV